MRFRSPLQDRQGYRDASHTVAEKSPGPPTCKFVSSDDPVSAKAGRLQRLISPFDIYGSENYF